MKRLVSIVLMVLFCSASVLAADAPKAKPSEQPADTSPVTYNTIVLQGLNKVTGHISRLEGSVGAAMRFGNLEIIPRRCWKSDPEDRPENAGLLEISEAKPGEPPQKLFLGWMFSSSPALSGLEHPVYDITMLSCEQRAAEPPPKDKEPEKAKPAKS